MGRRQGVGEKPKRLRRVAVASWALVVLKSGERRRGVVLGAEGPRVWARMSEVMWGLLGPMRMKSTGWEWRRILASRSRPMERMSKPCWERMERTKAQRSGELSMSRMRRPCCWWGLGFAGEVDLLKELRAAWSVGKDWRTVERSGVVEEAGDEGRGGGEAEVAAALAEGGHVADDEAEAHAVEAMDVGEVEDDFGGGVGAAVELGFEGGGFGAEDDGAVAVEEVDVVGEFGGEVEGHGCGNHTASKCSF